MRVTVNTLPSLSASSQIASVIQLPDFCCCYFFVPSSSSQPAPARSVLPRLCGQCDSHEMHSKTRRRHKPSNPHVPRSRGLEEVLKVRMDESLHPCAGRERWRVGGTATIMCHAFSCFVNNKNMLTIRGKCFASAYVAELYIAAQHLFGSVCSGR